MGGRGELSAEYRVGSDCGVNGRSATGENLCAGLRSGHFAGSDDLLLAAGHGAAAVASGIGKSSGERGSVAGKQRGGEFRWGVVHKPAKS